jgi:hypothetical protein
MLPPMRVDIGTGDRIPPLLRFNFHRGEQQMALFIEINRVAMRAVL